MKTTLKSILLIAIALIAITSCGNKKGELLPGVTAEFRDSVSYAIGSSLGSMVQQADFGDLNMKEVYKAMEDVLAERTLRIDVMYANDLITRYMMLKQEADSKINMAAGEKFLEDNKSKEGVIELESGLQYKIIKEGNGVTPAPEDTIEVHYVGTLIDGTQFDSSHERGQTASLVLNQFIPGWIEGLQKVSEGGQIELYIPADLAYGNHPMGNIQPGSTLIFDVELISVKKAN